MMNPTGGSVRIDRGGNGNYGAPRGDRKHTGLDISCIPGQDFRAFCTGIIIREAFPYADDLSWKGFVFSAKRANFKVFYAELLPDLVGTIVQEGTVIAKAQDISLRYPGSGVTPHIHLEITSCDPKILFGTEVG